MSRYEIKKVGNTWTIFLKNGDEFQEGFDSKEDAMEFLDETFG